MTIRVRANAAPPVADRPKCPECGKSLSPYWMTVKEENLPAPDFRRYTMQWQGGYHAYGSFCTMRCAVDFANAAYKAGYRIKRK